MAKKNNYKMLKCVAQIKDIVFSYHDDARSLDVIEHMSMDVQENEFVSIIGQSGCGKSTVLNLLGGFLLPIKGEVRIKEKIVEVPSSDRVLIFQEDSVFPWMTVRQNIAYGLTVTNVDTEKKKYIVDKYLEMMDLKGFEDYYPKNLSGGMKKRVDLARAYAVNPNVLLMDEPFGSLDAYTRKKMQVLLMDLLFKEKKTVVFVTHDIDEAIYLSDRVVVMTPRPSKIYEIIDIPFDRPRREDIRNETDYLNIKIKIESILRKIDNHNAV